VKKKEVPRKRGGKGILNSPISCTVWRIVGLNVGSVARGSFFFFFRALFISSF